MEAPAEAMQQASLAVAASTHLGPQPDGTALAVPELQGASQKQLAAAFSTAVAWARAGEAECSGLHALHVWTLADGLQARAKLHGARGIGHLSGPPHCFLGYSSALVISACFSGCHSASGRQLLPWVLLRRPNTNVVLWGPGAAQHVSDIIGGAMCMPLLVCSSRTHKSVSLQCAGLHQSLLWLLVLPGCGPDNIARPLLSRRESGS